MTERIPCMEIGIKIISRIERTGTERIVLTMIASG